MDSRADQEIKYGDELFSKRVPLMSLWQEQADNFYCERADFTVLRSIGMDFASILTTSYPLLCRRDLSNIFSTMLRPSDKEWFDVSVLRDDKLDQGGKRWLEWATNIQRRAMYDPAAKLQRATNEGDNDYIVFGQAVLSAELNRDGNALLHRCWHLRDVVWAEGYTGDIDYIQRKWKPTVREFCQTFPKYADKEGKLKERLEKQPFDTIEVRHIVKPARDWDRIGKARVHPFVSIYICVDYQDVIEEVGIWNKRYIIPRWQTVSGSQYSYSPVTVCALPDARLIQAISLILLEAGEKAVTPPMVTPGGVIRGDVNLFAGGITAYDASYDEKTGEVLRIIPHDYTGFNFGMQLRTDVAQMISKAFYLDKINLPKLDKEMTAFEVSTRVSEYVRNALPIFAPTEVEYNGALCEIDFDLLMRGGAFGAYRDMPKSIRGQDIQFKFQSPLQGALEQQKGAEFNNAKAMLAEAAALDPGAVNMIDVRIALRDALEGIGTPIAWMRSGQQMQAIDQQNAQQAQTQQLLDTLQKGANVAKTTGDAMQSLSGMPARTTAQAIPA
jgi:hypothetical protein